MLRFLFIYVIISICRRHSLFSIGVKVTGSSTIEAPNKGHLIHGFLEFKIFNDRNLKIKKDAIG
jgi:hypothetical protein